MKDSKEKCDCGNIAVWDYMPGYMGGGNSFCCDEHVPRGCTCNYRHIDINAYHPPLNNPDYPEGIEGKDWKWIEKDVIWTKIDEKGREYPCCEYDYDEEGFDYNKE